MQCVQFIPRIQVSIKKLTRTIIYETSPIKINKQRGINFFRFPDMQIQMKSIETEKDCRCYATHPTGEVEYLKSFVVALQSSPGGF